MVVQLRVSPAEAEAISAVAAVVVLGVFLAEVDCLARDRNAQTMGVGEETTRDSGVRVLLLRRGRAVVGVGEVGIGVTPELRMLNDAGAGEQR